jgi:hypothetical protein
MRDTNSPARDDLIGSVINLSEVSSRVMVGMGTRADRIVSSFAVLCVLATAGVALANEPGAADKAGAGAPAAIDLAGRWEGRSYELARRVADCSDERCMLVLDIARCQNGWCGVEVIGTERRCGATALKLDGGQATAGTSTLFKGKLELAKGTEPYVIEVYLMPGGGDDPKTELQITGDTGGEFRMFRRSFPYNATLVRSGDAHCRPESTVSLLD